MFLVVARHSELFFFVFTTPKCEMVEVDKAMIQGVEGHL